MPVQPPLAFWQRRSPSIVTIETKKMVLCIYVPSLIRLLMFCVSFLFFVLVVPHPLRVHADEPFFVVTDVASAFRQCSLTTATDSLCCFVLPCLLLLLCRIVSIITLRATVSPCCYAVPAVVLLLLSLLGCGVRGPGGQQHRPTRVRGGLLHYRAWWRARGKDVLKDTAVDCKE